MELLNQDFLENILKRYDSLKPIGWMSRVKTELGEGFVVGYSDLSQIYKLEGCVLVSNFKFPEYYVLLDKIILNPETQEKQRAHFFKKEDVKFIMTFNDWIEERNNKVKDYFDNIKMDRKAYKQKLMNKMTNLINEGKMDSSGLLQYKQNAQEKQEPSELMPSETERPLANAEKLYPKDEVKDLINNQSEYNSNLVEAIVKADELINESIEIEVKQTPKPKPKKKGKQSYEGPSLFG